MDTSLVPTFNMMNDYIANYTIGNIDLNQRLRAINRSIEDVHRTLGLTCDETIFPFLYVQDDMYTDLPVDFDEPISLVYQNGQYNIPGLGWNWAQYKWILQNSGAWPQWRQKYYSSTNINGLKQLMQLGANIFQGAIINSFNSLNLLSGTGDATTLAVDNNFYVNGGGSVSFTIDPTLGFGYAGILTSGFGIMNVQQALQRSGYYKVWSYLQNTNISNIQLILNCTGGTFTWNASTQDNGNPFSLQTWFKTQYPWPQVIQSGNPNAQEVTSYEFRYYENQPAFGNTPIPFFRINDFFLEFPDAMNLVYYSQYKGTDSTGTVKKIELDNLSDIPNYMLFFPDFQDMVAIRAARRLMPQLSGDKDFMAMYKTDYEEQLANLGKIYPRKRVVNSGQTILRRP